MDLINYKHQRSLKLERNAFVTKLEGRTVLMKNWEPPLLGPAFAMLRVPGSLLSFAVCSSGIDPSLSLCTFYFVTWSNCSDTKTAFGYLLSSLAGNFVAGSTRGSSSSAFRAARSLRMRAPKTPRFFSLCHEFEYPGDNPHPNWSMKSLITRWK
jgi:hypothetical protein